LVFFALEPFGVLALLAATLHPAPDLCVTSAIAIVTLHQQFFASLEDHIAIFVIGGKCHDSFPMLSTIPLIATLVASDMTSPTPLGPI